MVITVAVAASGNSPAAKLAMLVSCSQKLSQDARAVLFSVPSPSHPSVVHMIAWHSGQSNPIHMSYDFT